jgi:hypothetical protein
MRDVPRLDTCLDTRSGQAYAASLGQSSPVKPVVLGVLDTMVCVTPVTLPCSSSVTSSRMSRRPAETVVPSSSTAPVR